MLLRKREFHTVPLRVDEPPRPASSRTRIRTALEKIQAEILIQTALHHPKCVRIHRVVQTAPGLEGKYYIVMERASGGSLMTLMCDGAAPRFVGSHQKHYDEPLARCFFRDAAEALAYLHSPSVRVAHRDVKPDNLFLFEDGTAKLGDFSVAEVMGRDFRVYGTETNDSHRGHDGRAADVWALGVTLWCFLFGGVPFDCSSHEKLFDSILSWAPDIPAGAVSAECASLLKGLLQRSPTERVTAADALNHPWLAGSSRGAAAAYAVATAAVAADSDEGGEERRPRIASL
eukprot:Polyplicarium_translucidae@DN1576_c0_g1_i2.p1